MFKSYYTSVEYTLTVKEVKEFIDKLEADELSRTYDQSDALDDLGEILSYADDYEDDAEKLYVSSEDMSDGLYDFLEAQEADVRE